MNVVSKTRAHPGLFTDEGICYGQVSKTLRKIAHSRVVARKYGDRTGLCTGLGRGVELAQYFTI